MDYELKRSISDIHATLGHRLLRSLEQGGARPPLGADDHEPGRAPGRQ